MRCYRDLKVWQSAMDLVVQVYKVTARLPRREVYGLAGQMRRAAVSIASNIAEGNGRESTRGYIHHLSFAHGSVAELDTQIRICERLDYLDESEAQANLKLCEEVGKMLQALQRSLRNKEGMVREENDSGFYGLNQE
ncbi:MAG TPA: four helix bundle protein [Candidatus Hydrogenedentes bacterium]|nr:four helix bundle protein [Candidatus Hydrogenedentota bacterium]